MFALSVLNTMLEEREVFSLHPFSTASAFLATRPGNRIGTETLLGVFLQEE